MARLARGVDPSRSTTWSHNPGRIFPNQPEGREKMAGHAVGDPPNQTSASVTIQGPCTSRETGTLPFLCVRNPQTFEDARFSGRLKDQILREIDFFERVSCVLERKG
jgi:hypothetical protein